MENNFNYPIPMTLDEQKVLTKFHDLLNSKKLEYNSKIIDDSYLIRFLRARKLDINKTYEMFSNYVAWRKENNIDEIEKYDFTELPKVKVFYPHGFHKTDKEGRPIYIECLGDLKLDEMFKVTTPERLIKYQVKTYENLLRNTLPLCSQISKKCIYQTLTIIDLKKLSTKLLNKKVYEFLKLTSANSQNNYPECLGQLYVINTGFLFKAAWSVVKAFLDEKTRKKIIALGSDYNKKLLEMIEPCNLPAIFGGECKCEPYGCIYSNAGPWNTDNKIIDINPELLNNFENENEEREDKEQLEELSKQLKEKMELNGLDANIKHRMEEQDNDGETPINTQECCDDI